MASSRVSGIMIVWSTALAHREEKQMLERFGEQSGVWWEGQT